MRMVIEASYNGLSFGAPTEAEVIMAELVSELVPSMEMVRMVNSHVCYSPSSRLHQQKQNC